MTTKITIDPALVREIIPQIQKYKPEYIATEEAHIRISFRFRGELFAFMKEFKGGISDDGANLFYIDIHRFKDLAIEWCAGKGANFITEIINKQGKITVTMEEEKCWIYYSPYIQDEYKTRLSAELVAINFCWEQIQKEGKDEN